MKADDGRRASWSNTYLVALTIDSYSYIRIGSLPDSGWSSMTLSWILARTPGNIRARSSSLWPSIFFIMNLSSSVLFDILLELQLDIPVPEGNLYGHIQAALGLYWNSDRARWPTVIPIVSCFWWQKTFSMYVWQVKYAHQHAWKLLDEPEKLTWLVNYHDLEGISQFKRVAEN